MAVAAGLSVMHAAHIIYIYVCSNIFWADDASNSLSPQSNLEQDIGETSRCQNEEWYKSCFHMHLSFKRKMVSDIKLGVSLQPIILAVQTHNIYFSSIKALFTIVCV